MFDAIVLWLHILGAVVFIGPQIFLAAIAMPAIRALDDQATRETLTRQIARGFGILGGAALALILITGLWNFEQARQDDLMEFTRYFWVLNIKITMFLIVVVLTALHGMVLGRKLLELQQRGAPEAEIAAVRQQSMMVTMATLALSIVILLFAALLNSSWVFEGGLRS